MKQQTLEPVAETESALPVVTTTANVQALMQPRTSLALADVLEEFAERHREFRELFKAQLIEGEHFGTPPGVRRNDANPKQWVARPSLYQAGADKAMLLMNVRPEFEPDMNAWTQAGAKPGTYCIRCRLFSRDSGRVVGEGMGADKIGNKQRDENSALKMAQKRAKVAAVLNSFGLSEMFSQDLEDMGDDKLPAAETPRNLNAPQAKPRTGRVSKEQVGEIADLWKKDRASKDMPTTPEDFSAWVHAITGIEQRSALNSGSWIPANIDTCREALTGVAF